MKSISGALAALTVAGLLSGCGSGESAGRDDPASPPATLPTSAVDGPVGAVVVDVVLEQSTGTGPIAELAVGDVADAEAALGPLRPSTEELAIPPLDEGVRRFAAITGMCPGGTFELVVDDGWLDVETQNPECYVLNPHLVVVDVPAAEVPAPHRIDVAPVGWWQVAYERIEPGAPVTAVTAPGSLAAAEQVLGRSLDATGDREAVVVPEDEHAHQVVTLIETCSPVGDPTLELDGVRLTGHLEAEEDVACDAPEHYVAVWAVGSEHGPFTTGPQHPTTQPHS